MDMYENMKEIWKFSVKKVGDSYYTKVYPSNPVLKSMLKQDAGLFLKIRQFHALYKEADGKYVGEKDYNALISWLSKTHKVDFSEVEMAVVCSIYDIAVLASEEFISKKAKNNSFGIILHPIR